MFRTRNDHPKTSIKCGESLTQQHFANEVNIHNIMARAQKTGVLGDPYKPFKDSPIFGDFTAETSRSLHAAMNQLNQAEDLFMSLPAEERKKYNNDPRQLLLHYDQFIREHALNTPLESGSPADVPKASAGEPAGESSPA